ncbi:MAG: site-2 protease family protein [Deltaproteobacteria bacterium]|nr:site-2 protease family protein [Deltaproteobacteria bacterium]
MSIALAIAALGFLIVVHESGHYFVARWCKMRIERFSIGFGPGILKWKSKKTGTTFQLAPIPFGGFVEIKGMNIAEEVEPDDLHAYPNRPAWQRFVTIFAGPATNYLSAVVLAFLLYNCHGKETNLYHVGKVVDGYDAAGKLQPGDRIVSVDGTPMYAPSALALSEVVNGKGGEPIVLGVSRGLHTFTITLTPKIETDDKGKTKNRLDDQGKDTGKPNYRLGILQEADIVDVSVGDSLIGAVEYPIVQTKLIAGGFYDIIFGSAKADPGGPKRIVEEFSKAFESGVVQGIKLLAMLSVYLGLFNLFPLPALDGGRLVFLLYEMVTRRRANPKIEATVHMAGIMVLGVLMILVTLHDFHVL